MTVPIAYDVTRLFLGPLSRTPRGIDRVDFALAARLFRHSSQPCVGVMPTLQGMRVFSPHAVRRGLVRLQQLWAERRSIDDDALWQGLVLALRGESRHGDEVVPPPPFTHWQRARRMGSLISATGITLGASAKRHVPERAVYVNVGHISLAMPYYLRWLDARPDVTPVFMLHDVIPLDTPEYVSPSSARHHATMVASTARHAAGLLVTTATAQQTVTEALARFGRNDIMTLAQPLPVPRVFDTPATPDPALAGVKYFVICGAIEPRKNHALLFDVWRGLSADMGEAAPHLVIIGSPGWRSAEILGQLHDSPALRGRVHVVSGLSSPSLKRLLAGAIGLLMPSHAEGFGLPLIEAARLGVPVMASDIPAHREVVDSQALLLDPRDPRAWDAAIRHWARGDRPRVHPRPVQHAVDEREAYFNAVQEFLKRCAARRQAELAPRGYVSGTRRPAAALSEPALPTAAAPAVSARIDPL
ncbi:glycosyltransferase family 4 protein [Azorhizobium doebereinerae]|uniref:glycosyltransferase family 4 protein n=1 Tax=Azorhizobium doebereinerae TaxID=281091 RepID=UPI0004112C60|nr:glycosyltransferase family 1 protein [Azorhizobium doebereinerae]